MQKLWRLLLALLVLNTVVLVHEAGHYAACVASDVAVEELALGMGPVVASTEVGETAFTLRLLPLGGYVAPRVHGPRSYGAASVLTCSLIEAAGVASGLSVAFLLLLRRRGTGRAWRESFGRLTDFVRMVWALVRRRPYRPEPTEGGGDGGPMGPIGIIRQLYLADTWRQRLRDFALLNVALSCFNILPIYPLDGGKIADHVIFATLGETASHWFMQLGSLLLLGLFLLLMLRDGSRLIRK